MKRALLVALLVSACGGASDAIPPVAVAPAPEAPAAPEPARPPPGTLWRDEVVATVDAGLGAFLANRVVLKARQRHGEFQGFEVVTLRGADWWGSVDLRPGDVVRSINSMSIERETDAFDVFESLRQAPELVVTFSRDGQLRALKFTIVERPGSVAPPPSVPPAPASAPAVPAGVAGSEASPK